MNRLFSLLFILFFCVSGNCENGQTKYTNRYDKISFIQSERFEKSINYCKSHHYNFYIINFVRKGCIEIMDNDPIKSSIYKEIKLNMFKPDRYIFVMGNSVDIDAIGELARHSREIYFLE